MNRLGLFLALFFGLLLCASSVFARGSLLTWPHPGNTIAAAEACTLDVVLVTFRDAHWLKHRTQLHQHLFLSRLRPALGRSRRTTHRRFVSPARFSADAGRGLRRGRASRALCHARARDLTSR